MSRSCIKRIRRESAFFAILLFLYLGHLLPHSLVITCGKFIGWIAYSVLRKPRRRMLKNLNIVFGQKYSLHKLENLCKRNFQHWGICLFEVVKLMSVRSIQDLENKVKVYNLKLLEKALGFGKGVLLMTPHLGNWEITAAYLSLKGYKFAVLAKEVYDLRLNEVLIRVRGGRKIINIPRDSMFTAVKYLKQGYILGILPDQATKVTGEYIDFFSKPAYTPTGPAKLSIKIGTPMLLFYNYRDERGKINIFFDEILTQENDEILLTKKWSGRFEEYILKFPEQWVWMHERWKKI